MAEMFRVESGFAESVAARSFAASRVMSFPEVRKRSAPEVISDWRLVLLSIVLSPPFFLLPQCWTVRSLRIEVVMLMSPLVASRRVLPVDVILDPWLLMSLPATRTMLPADSIIPWEIRVERMLLAVEFMASDSVADAPLIL